MGYKDFKDTLDLARAHELAISKTYKRQAFVTVAFFKNKAKVYSFMTCVGACEKCNAIWLKLRLDLASIEMVQIDPPEAAAPSEAVELSN